MILSSPSAKRRANFTAFEVTLRGLISVLLRLRLRLQRLHFRTALFQQLFGHDILLRQFLRALQLKFREFELGLHNV